MIQPKRIAHAGGWSIVSFVLMVVLTGDVGNCLAQATKKSEPTRKPEPARKAPEPVKHSSEPLAQLPASTVLLIVADGGDAHRAAWQKTAAFEAFGKTGLIDSFKRLIEGILEQIPDERMQSLVQIFEFVSDHGLTISIGLPPGDGPAIPYLTVVAHDAGPHGDVLDQFVDALGPDVELVKDDVSKRRVSRFMAPNVPGLEVAWWTEGPHLVLVAGMGAVDSALAVVNGKSPNLAATENGKKLSAKGTFDRTCLGWLDFAALRSRFSTIPLPTGDGKTVGTVLKSLGLDTFNQLTAQAGYQGRSLWSTFDVDAPGPRKGLFGLADPNNAVMTLDDLPPLPVNHFGFAAQSVSIAAAYDKLLQVVRELATFGPPDVLDQLDDALEKIPQFIGCDLRDDILSALGPVQCIYSDSNQALLGADYGIVLQVSDPPKLRQSIKKMIGRLTGQIPDHYLTVIDRDRHGQKLITFQIGAGALNPTLLVGEKWLTIGMTPQTIEAFALRLKGELPSWKPDAETAEVLAAVPKKFAAISIAYPRPIIRGIVSVAPFLLGFGQSALDQARRTGAIPPIQLRATSLDIPPAELVVKPLFPNVTWCVVDEAGIHSTTRSSAPSIPLVGGGDGSTIAASAILVALLLPAVQQAREAARRTQSKNNLKQIALALHNFHDVYGNFPQGTIPSKTLKPEERQSWLVQILPFIDQAPLYNSMGVDLRESDKWNDDSLQQAIAVQIMMLRNPSQPASVTPGEPAPTDYAGWAGVGQDAPTEKCKPEKKGIFGYDRATKLREVTDGTSNTVMVSDVVAKDRGPWAQGGPATIRALTAKPYVNGVDGIGSPHVGGFHVVLTDGSVRFVSNNINPDTLEALATRAGGEIIGDY